MVNCYDKSWMKKARAKGHPPTMQAVVGSVMGKRLACDIFVSNVVEIKN